MNESWMAGWMNDWMTVNVVRCKRRPTERRWMWKSAVLRCFNVCLTERPTTRGCTKKNMGWNCEIQGGYYPPFFFGGGRGLRPQKSRSSMLPHKTTSCFSVFHTPALPRLRSKIKPPSFHIRFLKAQSRAVKPQIWPGRPKLMPVQPQIRPKICPKSSYQAPYLPCRP